MFKSNSWLRKFLYRWEGVSRASAARKPCSYRPFLEELEPRDVPSGAPPSAMGIEGLTVLHGQTIANINLLGQCSDPENDPLDIEIVNYPNHGMVIFNYTTSLYEYQVFMTDVGPDSFTFRAFDGTSYSSLATVSLTITNTPPVASDLGTLNILHGQTIDNIDLWGNSSDADNDDLAITIVDYPTYGMVI